MNEDDSSQFESKLRLKQPGGNSMGPWMSYRLNLAFLLLSLLFLSTAAMSHGRYAFSGILSRPAGSWPGGKRLAVYVKISIEDFPFGVGGPALVPGLPMPDVMNYAWRDYGNRVGIYRLLDDLDRLGIPAAFATNTMVYETCPGLMDTIRASGRHEVRLPCAHFEVPWENDEVLMSSGGRPRQT
jgi:hypothetical protein